MLNQKCGALWKRESNDGKKYHTGVIETMFGQIQIAVFKNDKKEKENQPDFNIVYNGIRPYENKRSQTKKIDDGLDDFDAAAGEVPVDEIPQIDIED